MNNKDWISAKCKNCGDTVRSSGGDWQCCTCFQLRDGRGFYLDHTPWYTRVGGNNQDIIWTGEEDEHK